jgi:FPC/CPF motif-containing protein YcgG
MIIGNVPDWGPERVEVLIATILSAESPFPCTLAVSAAKREALRFAFVDGPEPDYWAGLPAILREYFDIYQSLGRDTSLAVIFRPEGKLLSMDEYRQRFWSVLNYLHHADGEPWPAEVPTDPASSRWEFSFGGVPMFVVCNTPAHDRRRSRYSPDFLITFQPRWVFEGLESHSPRGASVRRAIRRRLRAYDGVDPSPLLGSYGDIGNQEWRQYFLDDDNTAEVGPAPRCPFPHATTSVPTNSGPGGTP